MEAVNKQDIIKGDPFGEIQKEIAEALGQLDKFDQGLKDTAKSFEGLSKNSRKTVQDIDAITKAEIESEKLLKQKVITQQTETKLLIEQEKLKQAAIRTAKAENSIKEKTLTLYQQESRKLNDLRNAYKNLAVQNKENTKEAKALLAQITPLDAKLKAIDKTVGQSQRSVGNYEKGVRGLRTAFGALGVAFGASQIVGFLKESTELARIQEKAVAQVAAGLASTGGVAGYTLDELKAKASEFQGQTLFGDEQILTELTSVMLTFTNVTGKAFDGAQQAALDLSTRMGGDLKGAAVQLGKALNDPIKGVTALRKVGVSFTQEQMDQIKVLQESGDLMGAQTIILNEMNKEFSGSAKAAADADGGITQLSNAWGDAKEMMGALILEGLKPAITGLKDFFTNLKPEDVRRYVGYIGSLFTVLKRLAQGYILLKVAQLAFMSDTGKLNFSLTQLKTNLAGSTSGLGKMAGSLKSIGFAAAIGLAFELAKTFYDIASGAEAARDAAARLDKQLAKSSKDAAARVSERTNSASTQIAELQRQRNENKITEKEFLAQKKAITEATKEEIKADIQKVNVRKINYVEESDRLKERIKLLALENSFSANLQIRELGFELNQVNANIQGSNVRLKEYYAELLAVGEATKDLTSDLIVEDDNLKKTTDRTKQKAKAVEDLTNKVEDSFLTLEQMHEMEMKRLEEEKRIMQEINELNRELNNDMANDNTIVDVIPEEFSDMELLGLGIISDSMKEKFNAFEEFQKGLTNILTEQIDARIAQLKKEEDAAKSTQDYLQELAANGNINAQQSITQAIEFQRESQAEQARLERTKQQIQLISSGLSTFNKEIADGKKPGEALVSTGFVMQTLIGLLKNVQFFAKGTDNAPEGLAVVDEKGAEIITDKKGKIKEIGTGKGARFTHLSKGDKVFTANQTANILDQFGNIQNGQTIDRRFDVAGNSYDLMMLNKLGGIEKAIKESGSSSHTEWGGIFNGVGEIVERKMKNGNIVTNRYRMKS